MPATVQVVLRADLPNLGKIGDVVRVRPGYARNYLVPRALAVFATARSLARVEHERKVAASRAAKVRAEAAAAAERLAGVVVRIARRVSVRSEAAPAGDPSAPAPEPVQRLFGSITTRDVEAALRAQGIDVDRRKIVLPQPIRELGTFEVFVRLPGEQQAKLSVEVVAQEA